MLFRNYSIVPMFTRPNWVERIVMFQSNVVYMRLLRTGKRVSDSSNLPGNAQDVKEGCL